MQPMPKFDIMLYLASNRVHDKFGIRNSITLKHKFSTQCQILAITQENSTSIEMLLIG